MVENDELLHLSLLATYNRPVYFIFKNTEATCDFAVSHTLVTAIHYVVGAIFDL